MSLCRKSQLLREAMLFCLHQKKKRAECHRLLQKAYEDYSPTEKSVQNWYRQFKDGYSDTEDKERRGQGKKYEDGELKTLLDKDPIQTQEEH